MPEHLDARGRRPRHHLGQRRAEARRFPAALDAAYDPLGEGQLGIVPQRPGLLGCGEQEVERLVPRDALGLPQRHRFSQREADGAFAERQRLALGAVAVLQLDLDALPGPSRRQDAERISEKLRRLRKAFEHRLRQALGQEAVAGQQPDFGLFFVERHLEAGA